MVDDNFYNLVEPAEWAEAPAVFSYSTLKAINKCPLQWQLTHSKFGPKLHKFPARPSPAAVEGNIIHSVLEKLFRELSLIGLPALGTATFSECVANVNIKREVHDHILLHDDMVTRHPRGSGFRLRSSPQQLVNKIIRLFRQQYLNLFKYYGHQLPVIEDRTNCLEGKHESYGPISLLKKYNVLSEYRIEHSTLPFMGVIDFIFIEDGQPVIVDFKTGEQSRDHMKQVMIYALLWKSQTGQVPKRLEVRYPHIVDSVMPDDSDLVEEEKKLSISLDEAIRTVSTTPAEACLNAQCLFCDVRQFCEIFWEENGRLLKVDQEKEEFADIELTIVGVPTAHGFVGKTSIGEEITVVFSDNTIKLHASAQEGQCLRILSVLMKDSVVRVLPKTEFYYVCN